MNDSSRLSESEFQAICDEMRAIAQSHEGDCWALLAILRRLEHLHRQIREDLFQASLPSSRHQLYDILREIDESGGWPYIERAKLRAFLVNLQGTQAIESTAIASDSR